jgi:hypothetical protein
MSDMLHAGVGGIGLEPEKAFNQKSLRVCNCLIKSRFLNYVIRPMAKFGIEE